jgi:hypothetical protein
LLLNGFAAILLQPLLQNRLERFETNLLVQLFRAVDKRLNVID